jgi:hypothetical protein
MYGSSILAWSMMNADVLLKRFFPQFVIKRERAVNHRTLTIPHKAQNPDLPSVPLVFPLGAARCVERFETSHLGTLLITYQTDSIGRFFFSTNLWQLISGFKVFRGKPVHDLWHYLSNETWLCSPAT